MASPFLSSSSNPTLVSSILGGMTCTTIRSKQKGSFSSNRKKPAKCMTKQSKSDNIEKCYEISRNQSLCVAVLETTHVYKRYASNILITMYLSQGTSKYRSIRLKETSEISSVVLQSMFSVTSRTKSDNPNHLYSASQKIANSFCTTKQTYGYKAAICNIWTEAAHITTT